MGDIVGAVDNVTGIAISVPISKKIISIQNDYLSAAYETEIGKVRTSNSGQINGSGGTDGAAGGAVRYDIQQTLSDTEKAQARANIGAGTGLAGAVRYDIQQTISAYDAKTARQNIGAGTSDFDGRYSSLTGRPTIPTKTSDLTNDSGFGTYSKPAGGIPESDLSTDVQTKLNLIGTFRINVTYSNGVYTADKTFTEIKAAYDAGQQPYVVYGGNTIYTLSSCYFASEQMFMDFERHLIGKDTLETETLRIYSYTTDSGSNIVKRTSSFDVPSGTTYIAVDSTNDAIFTVNGETYADIQALIDASKPVVVRFDNVLDFYYFETFGLSDSSGTHRRLNFRCDMGSIVYTLTLRDDNTWAFSETSLQPSSITDTGGYFNTDTVEGALQEIGAELTGINTLLGSGEITS